MCAAAIVPLAILARQTTRARLLVLGYPIGHRPDPLRAAEELATIDVISRGRLDMGFIKARAFYTGVLLLKEKVKPEALARRGGAWFTNGTIEVHLGVEKTFAPPPRPTRLLSCAILPASSNGRASMAATSPRTSPCPAMRASSFTTRSATASS
jgi:hypothetical protein